MRLRTGLSQRDVANLMGSTQSHVARIESGSQDVQVTTLVRFAAAIGVTPRKALDAFLDSAGS